MIVPIILSLILGSYALEPKEIPLHPDTRLNISQLLDKYGYPFESHSVQTEDGYILGVHRIPNPDKPAVLIVHGLLSSSVDFVNGGPNMSLAMQLADEGYDVWLGNCRGNTFSKNHISLDPNTNSSFWKFSFNEMGKYDLAAKIDYILKVTGHQNISYVGHSQGTTTFMALMALRPEYNEKVNVMAALSPVAFLDKSNNTIMKILSDNELAIDIALSTLGIYDILPHSPLITELAILLCNIESPFVELCADFLFEIVGDDSPQLDRFFITVIASNAPAGASFNQFKHYFQIYRTGLFRQYDYGILENLEVYGQTTPPEYNISKITAPMALYYANNDAISDILNVYQLRDLLPNVVRDYLVPLDAFNHLDFIFAKDVKSLVNNDVVDVLNKYSNK